MAPEALPQTDRRTVDAPAPDLSSVFHRLNNQLGIVLANAELLEARLTDDPHRARAGQIVTGVLAAMTSIQDLRRIVGPKVPLDVDD